MRGTAAVLVVAALWLASTGTAAAQTSGANDSGNYVAFLGGADFSPSDAVIAVEYGERVTPNVQAYVTLTYLDDVMRQDLNDELASLSNALTAQTGMPWLFTGRDRGVAFVGGARYRARLTPTVRPYIGAGAGALNIRRTINEGSIGDARLAVLNDYGIGSAELTGEGRTRPLVEGVAGVIFTPARRLHLDLGYRLQKAFGFGEDITISQVSVGIGYRF